ncbi:hypothetical protein M8998_10485 [Sphingobacterium sp. lm-10]|uniref:hypothetical protein n=1 Tax=Sphingobacterium sp. lm-10 TaxID=2944904 RepID=UPI00202147C7|nr:hypothetical protein [Sphingobacterium sp. lm-10]MCL7988365.1 hypothetical protein [Sphingobacterium sp. lm-10]
MKPIWKWIIGIVGAIIVLLLAAAWYLSNNYKPILETKLKEIIAESSDGLYTLEYDALDLNLLLGNVTLKNAVLVPDSAVYEKLVAEEKAPDNRFHIALDELKVRRFSVMDLLLGKGLKVNSINLARPKVHMINEPHAFNDTVSNDPPKSLYEQIKDDLSSIAVKKIDFTNMKLTHTQIVDGKKSKMALDSVQLHITDVLIDETSEQDSTRLFYTKMVDLSLPGFEYDLPDGFYRAKFDHLKLNTQQRDLIISKLSFSPRMSKAEFFKKQGKKTTMAIMKLDTLKIEGLDIARLIDQNKIYAKDATLKNGSVSLFMDMRYPSVAGSKIGKAPHQQIMKLKQSIKVDTVHIDNLNILYGEFSKKYSQEGIITFDGARGVITNVTNDTLSLQKDKFMRADLRARIMNSGNLHAIFGFDMLSKNGAHTYKGSLGAMKATAFNRIIKPLVNVEISSGNIRKVSFDMAGTDYRNWGDFRFDYDDLKIKILGSKDEEGKRSGKGILSFLVNQLIINDSNPDANEVYHKGYVKYTRDPSHSFWKTLWQSMLDGIKQTAGITAEREAKLTDAGSRTQRAASKAKEAAQKTGGFIKGLFSKKDKDEQDKKEKKDKK